MYTTLEALAFSRHVFEIYKKRHVLSIIGTEVVQNIVHRDGGMMCYEIAKEILALF
jgi:hypothetical protein